MLIVDLPGVLREIVRDTVSLQNDMVVVGEVAADATIPDAVNAAAADVVILDSHHPVLADLGPAALSAQTGAQRLLAVGADGREAFLYALRPARVALGELSPDRLSAAIRAGTALDSSGDGQ